MEISFNKILLNYFHVELFTSFRLSENGRGLKDFLSMTFWEKELSRCLFCQIAICLVSIKIDGCVYK